MTPERFSRIMLLLLFAPFFLWTKGMRKLWIEGLMLGDWQTFGTGRPIAFPRGAAPCSGPHFHNISPKDWPNGPCQWCGKAVGKQDGA
jgi:hypothetical protein